MSMIRTLAVFATLSLVGCDEGKRPVVPAKAGAGASTLTNGMEFSGERDCVDCDGIESWLRLEQAGKARRYRMVEVYYGQDHERRFEDTGEWSTQGELLRLRSSHGGERVYARIEDGYLQARGAHGQRIPSAEDDVLEPARFDSTH
ncbi:copper resistance protein NlpE N-terminal domain-containing protein [Thermomonas sp.]|uniref:copper resistance protein NlpE N-terminal domain-containing protein n=1 Tax=Thermomonas sp. TaxID=1971895 RepID=UPI002489E60F|nr:copper resistance protein NlpE N-terminal domain-containing protein [Thermomonas sp.]MDI1254089.1 copper resistance protein NlpE N-terminal domain-containing protein [Thermomonas sp.]